MHDRPRILLPVSVLEGESIPEGVPELLTNAHVVLLGYHVVPDQTATEQARDQFEAKATRRLDELAELLESAGAAVESTLVFTHDGQTTIDRMTADHDCLAVLLPQSTGPVENVLVAVRGVVGVDRFVRLLLGLFATDDVPALSSRVRSALSLGTGTSPEIGLTLYHVAGEDETDDDVQTLLDGVASRLADEGIPPDTIDTEVARGGEPAELIVEASEDYDAIVMGESDPSVATFVFGMTADSVAGQFLGPVFVVQHGEPDDDGPTDAE